MWWTLPTQHTLTMMVWSPVTWSNLPGPTLRYLHAGIINPLLKRNQAGLVAQRIFSCPAVKVWSCAP